MKIPLSKPEIGDQEIEHVTRVLRSGQLSLGPRIREFEEKFAAYVGRRYAVAVNSGTSALHLCVRALGIGKSDEVITTSFSFVASANCLLFEGALPVFVDIDPLTLNIDARKIAGFLRTRCTSNAGSGELVDLMTGRTVKGILPVHIFGLPCDMDPIVELAREHKLFIIEDACESVGAKYKGRSVGTFGDAGIFAFYPNKQMTTGEGGMIVTDDPHLAELCRSMRNQGRSATSEWLEHVRLGFNYRLSDLHSALGLAQMERLESLLYGRKRVAGAYNRLLAANSMLSLPAESPDSERSWFAYVIRISQALTRRHRDDIICRLRQNGIGCQAYFPAIHRQPYMKEFTSSAFLPLNETESASDHHIALPFFAALTEHEVRYVCDTLTQELAAVDDLRLSVSAD